MQDITQILYSPSQFRQGDVLVIPVTNPINENDLGDLVQEADSKRVVLAYGEVTGHAHAYYPDLDIDQNHVEEYAKVRLYDLKKECGRKYAEFDIHNKDSMQREIAIIAEDHARILRLTAPCLLRHGRHGGDDFDHYSILTPAGDYIICYQFEADYYKEIRRVTD